MFMFSGFMPSITTFVRKGLLSSSWMIDSARLQVPSEENSL